MKDAPEPWQDPYARLARLYDPVTSWALAGLRRRLLVLVKTCLKAHGPWNRAVVLDICCGTGVLARMLAAELGKGHALPPLVVGMDISPAMLSRAMVVAKSPKTLSASGQADLLGPLFVRACGTRLPLPEGRISCAIICLALHENTPDVARALLQEARRVLAPDGRLLLVDYLAPRTIRSRAVMRPVYIVESLAGQDHFAGFKRFLQRGGVVAAARDHGWAIERMEPYVGGTIGVVVAAPTSETHPPTTLRTEA